MNGPLPRARLAAVALCVLALGGCAFHVQEMGAPQANSFKVWGPPAVGEYLCLSAVPGTPVYARPNDGLFPPQLIGYTKDVVAFKGWQNGEEVAIVYYTGGIGWIDGHKISPVAYPGQRCIVPGLDLKLRPIFEID